MCPVAYLSLWKSWPDQLRGRRNKLKMQMKSRRLPGGSGHGASLERFEPCEGKLSRTVRRGGVGGLTRLRLPGATMFTPEKIHDFFDHTRQLKRDGRARYDIDDVCRWSFFLIDADREKLTRAGRHIEQQ